MDNLDLLVENAAINALAETGAPAPWVLKQSRMKPRKTSGLQRMPAWSPEETQFVLDHLPYLPMAEVAAKIGRTTQAIHIQMAREKRFPCMSKYPGWVTGHGASKILGSDIHSIMKMQQLGILKFEILPGPRHIMRIRKISLYVWACDPMNWPYFRQENVTDPYLKRLLDLKKERWEDEWWSIGKVAQYHGVTESKTVNSYLERKGLKNHGYGVVDWGNWWILRSVAMKMKFWVGKGFSCREWSPRADDYILHARAAGMRYKDIGARMGWNKKTVEYRYRVFLKGKNK